MIYLTSDLHFYHKNVIGYCNRPFNSVEHMNEALVANWNSVVGPEDTVYCLGDFSMAIRPVELFTPRLNGIKYLVPGNHDHCFPSHKKARGERLPDKIAFYEAQGWKVLPIHNKINLGGMDFNMSHMPYKGDNTDDRHGDWKLEDDGNWLLCGHVHEKWQTKGRMINVGVDVHNYYPISIDRIMELVNEIRTR